jgi:hypothetical protein
VLVPGKSIGRLGVEVIHVWWSFKQVDKAQMKRLVTMTIIKICGEAILLTIIAGIIIGIIGNWKKWDTPIAYSNTFFIADCLLIVAGASSRLAASQEWKNFQSLYVGYIGTNSTGTVALAWSSSICSSGAT